MTIYFLLLCVIVLGVVAFAIHPVIGYIFVGYNVLRMVQA